MIKLKPRQFLFVSGYLAHHRTTVRCKFHLSPNLSMNPKKNSAAVKIAKLCRRLQKDDISIPPCYDEENQMNLTF